MDTKSQLKRIIQEEVRRQLESRPRSGFGLGVQGDVVAALQSLQFSPSEYADFMDNLLFVEEELTDALGINISNASVSLGENSRLSVGFSIGVKTDLDLEDHFNSLDEDLGITSEATDRTGYLMVIAQPNTNTGIRFNQFKKIVKSLSGNASTKPWSYQDGEKREAEFKAMAGKAALKNREYEALWAMAKSELEAQGQTNPSLKDIRKQLMINPKFKQWEKM